MMDSSVFDGKGCLELDLLESSSYYKLPFCDEDPDMLFDFTAKEWSDASLDKLGYAGGFSPSHSPAMSPSSSYGSSSETAHSLLNERPDTPLMAVKFEDFNDYGLDDINYPPFLYESEKTTKSDEEELNVCDDFDAQMPISCATPDVEDFLTTGSERVVDCSLAATVPSCDVDRCISSATINKTQNGALIKSRFAVKEKAMDFSFSKDQPITCSSAATINQSSFATSSKSPSSSSSSSSSVFSVTSSDRASPSVKDQKSNVEELIGLPDLVALPPSHKIKVTVPQGRLAGNTFTHKAQIHIPTSALQTILKNGKLVSKLQQEGQTISKIRIKTENGETETTPFHYVKINQNNLPPTPPSSTSSDAESSLSPRTRTSVTGSPTSSVRAHIRLQPPNAHLASHLLGSTQRLSQSHGIVTLTEEEKRTLIAEGYAVPSKFPLSKSEEKSLKKIRRKIKNKLSAQESRRKKKEYVETLEKRMDDFNKENLDLKRKLDSLESSNRSLLSQLRSLQTLVAGKMPKPSRTVTTQTSSCLMMIVLCFAVFLGAWFPHLSPMVTSGGLSALSSRGPSIYGVQHLQGQSRVVASIKEGDPAFRCFDDLRCPDNERLRDPKPVIKDVAATDPGVPEPASETYDGPAGGRVTSNDTGDQVGKIIANTMEPRSAADVMAGRKVAVRGAKMEVVIDPGQTHDVARKIASSQLVTE